MASISDFVEESVVAQEDSPIRVMNKKVNAINKEREQEGFDKVPNLSLGQPDVTPLDELIDEINNRFNQISKSSPEEQARFFSYQNPQGGDATREKISEFYKHQYPESDISSDSTMIYNGATHFSSTLFSSLRSEKNSEQTKIAVFAPYFPSQKDQVEMSGKEFVPIHVEKGESPAEALSRTIRENKSENGDNLISAVFLSYPNNPTGNYLSKEQLSGIMDVVKEQGDMMLGVEKLYDKIAKNPNDIVYPLQIDPKYHEKVPYAEAASLSKGYSLPGSHIAYGFASDDLMQQMSKVSFKTICGPSAESENTLRAVIDFEMSGKFKKFHDKMRNHYIERVETLSSNMPDGFQKHPLVNEEKQGGFYVVMGSPEWIGKDIPDSVTHKKGDKTRIIDGIKEKLGKDKFENGHDISNFLVEAEIAAVVPMKPFGLDEPYFRASCATDKDAIYRAARGMSSCNKGVIEGVNVVVKHEQKSVTQRRSGSFAQNVGIVETPQRSESNVATLIAKFNARNVHGIG